MRGFRGARGASAMDGTIGERVRQLRHQQSMTQRELAEHGGVLAIRRAITARHEDEDPASLEDLRQQASYAWRSYWSNRFDLLAGQLPAFLGAARATARATPSPEVFAVLSDAYCAAASMLTLLGYVDLGYVAMDRAIGAADRSNDELRRAAFSGYMSWLLLHTTSRMRPTTC